MRILTWNVRGLGSEAKSLAVRRLVLSQKVEVLFLQETKKQEITESEIHRLWPENELEYRISNADGMSRGLIVIWDKSKFSLDSSLYDRNFIFLKGIWLQGGLEVILINVYAPCVVSEQSLYGIS
ncbi:hypothetical protein HRI_003050000 [Hibiscus trionum]|uniref:Endonuclease/exonuclease/phosphatase domain-containing protein n=1 Tax=Hibiscus trionum TaxID=183268 RepID=A0A9W7ICP4_HIBTR|nr:hypothetical protein HRI_003049900 [Hibiscus trionum]GMI93807.1 hypothetical protein HRI_003050000 [Hibiscus trionum]